MILSKRPVFITFDVFGTLFRAEETISQDVMERIIQKFDLPMDYQELIEVWWDRSYKVALDGFVTVREATRKALALLFDDYGIRDDPKPFTVDLMDSWAVTDVYPEVPQALGDLEDFTLGIVSNIDEDMLEALMRRSGLGDVFAVKVTSEATMAYKPNPKIFHMALRLSGFSPAEALHLGDSPVDDVLGPKRVGMMAGWVNRRGESLRGRIPKPDFVVSDLQEAARLILQSEPEP